MKTCKLCNKEFEKGIKDYCSWSCRNKDSAKNVKYIICKICNKEIRQSNLSVHKKSCKRLNTEKNCPKCKKVFKGDNKFCSHSCANSHIISEEHKEKLRQNKYWGNNVIIREKKVKNKIVKEKTIKIREKKYCVICNKEITSKEYCKQHYMLKPGYSEKQSLALKKAIQEGKLDRWYKNKEGSYAEKWWQQFLKDNNIAFIWQHREGLYLLDFVLEKNGKKIDFEIDGKQHLWEDRKLHDIKRAAKLKEKGYDTFRVQWFYAKDIEKIENEKQNFLDFWSSI
jgi:very-short-patch-repair endonuclease